LFAILQGKVVAFRSEGMWQILRASFWKFSKLSSGGISPNWSTTDEVTTRKASAYFLRPTPYNVW